MITRVFHVYKTLSFSYDISGGLFITTMLKVRLRWFWADLVKLQYLCHLSWDLNVLYVK